MSPEVQWHWPRGLSKKPDCPTSSPVRHYGASSECFDGASSEFKKQRILNQKLAIQKTENTPKSVRYQYTKMEVYCLFSDCYSQTWEALTKLVLERHPTMGFVGLCQLLFCWLAWSLGCWYGKDTYHLLFCAVLQERKWFLSSVW